MRPLGFRVTERPAYVYLLRCRDGSLYCGWTYDVAKRAAAHGRGTASKYTGARLPVEVAAVFQLRDASAARREEARIKRLSRAQKLALVESGPRDASAVRVG